MIFAVYFYLLLKSFLHTSFYPVQLGDTTVQVIQQTGDGKTFVHLHENESTALQAAKLYIDFQGGSLITLHHSGNRNISFNLHHVHYEFDPNRIFTDIGIEKTLKQYGPYSAEAAAAVKQLANQIKELLPRKKIIAVHNNNNYSLADYFSEHPLAKEAQAIHYKPQSSYRNFYFVTRHHTFNRLRNLAFNVALQSNQASDDGSLSYYLAKHDYINIEAGYNEIAAQLLMIDKA